MATHTLTVASSATAGGFFGNPSMNEYYNTFGMFTFSGDTDSGVCMQVASDGKELIQQGLDGSGRGPYVCFFTDDGLIPMTTINSVQLFIRIRGTNTHIQDPPGGGGAFIFGGMEWFFHMNGAMGASYSTVSSDVMILNPATGLAWTRSDLFSQGDTINGLWGVDNLFAEGGDWVVAVDYIGLLVDYVGGAVFPISGVVPAVGPTIGGS